MAASVYVLTPEQARHTELLTVLYRVIELLQPDRVERPGVQHKSDITSQIAQVHDAISTLPSAFPSYPTPPTPPSASEIAKAISLVLPPPSPVLNPSSDLLPLLDKIADKLTSLSRQVAAGLVSPSGSSLNIDNYLRDIKNHLSDYEARLDYDTRTDSNPVYTGRALNSTPESSSHWTVQKLEYDFSARLTRVQVLEGAWANRTTLNWS